MMARFVRRCDADCFYNPDEMLLLSITTVVVDGKVNHYHHIIEIINGERRFVTVCDADWYDAMGFGRHDGKPNYDTTDQ